MAEDDQRNRSVKALRILAYVLVVLILLGVIWLIVSGPKRTLPFLDLSARAERAEMRRKTHAFSIDSPEGKIEVLDIRTGSEFLRLITMPNGTTVAARKGRLPFIRISRNTLRFSAKNIEEYLRTHTPGGV